MTTQSQSREKWFRVEVTDEQGSIVAISSEMLAGREIGEHEEATIRKAIGHLTGFVGVSFIASQPSPVMVDGWQPIETAPKNEGRSWDQPRFMAYFGTTLCEAFWDPDDSSKKPKPFWNTWAKRTNDARANQPTAWQPLPPTPKDPIHDH